MAHLQHLRLLSCGHSFILRPSGKEHCDEDHDERDGTENQQGDQVALVVTQVVVVGAHVGLTAREYRGSTPRE
jgi:hypothetical protein